MRERFLKKLENLEYLNLPKDQYVIWGSGPLAIRGLREARDVDLVVTKKLWEALAKKYTPEGSKKNKIVIGDIEIWNDILNLTPRIDEIISESELIEGFPFLKLSYTLEWKRYWNSSKDPQDIILIEEFLKN